MDFYKDVIQPGVGFCLFCCVVGGAIKACLDSNKPTYSSTQSSTYDYPSSSSSEEEPEPSPDPSPDPEWEEYWDDDPFCEGTGNCPLCHGEKGEYIDNIYYVCGLCGGHGQCNNCGGQGQVKMTRQVYR